MLFALIFTLLAAADIFIVLQCKSLGMAPMYYFVAGIITVFFIFLQTHSRQLKQILRKKFHIFMIFIYLITAYHLLSMLQLIALKEIITDDTYFNMATVIHCSLAFYAIVFSLLLVLRKAYKLNEVMKWIISLAFFEGLRHTLLGVLVEYPRWLLRTDGVIDLGLIFSSLMIIFTLIDQEFTLGISRDTKTFMA